MFTFEALGVPGTVRLVPLDAVVRVEESVAPLALHLLTLAQRLL